MADRHINEFLASGDANDISIKTINIREYVKADLAKDSIGSYWRVGDEGFVNLHVIPFDMTHWTDTDSQDYPVHTPLLELLSVTVDEDIAVDECSINTFFIMTNNNVYNRKVWVQVQVNGVMIHDEREYVLTNDGSQHDIDISMSCVNPLVAGDTISVHVRSPIDTDDIQVRGLIRASILRVTKTVNNSSRYVEYSGTVGSSISRADIDSVIQNPKDMHTYYITDDSGRVFSAVYSTKLDKFACRELDLV